MESGSYKLQFLLPDAQEPIDGVELRADLFDMLKDWHGVQRFQLNLSDNDVSEAHARKIGGPYIGMASIWVDPATVSPWRFTETFLKAIAQMKRGIAGAATHAYLVDETHVLQDQALANNQRCEGFCQVAVLSCPEAMPYEAWLSHWRSHHTRIAVATQSTFRYVQNRVLTGLTCNTPRRDAIVEECFPAAAMVDDAVFYDAVDDPVRLHRNQRDMMDSCAKFIDFDSIVVLPTSEYRYRYQG